MTISENKIYPRTDDTQTVYLKNVIISDRIKIGDYTMYNDFVHDPREFEKNNVLYHYPVNGDQLQIGKFCSIACGAKFLFTSANHTMSSLSTYPFPIFFEEWGLDIKEITSAWDNKGDIVIGNDVWIGFEAVILSGVQNLIDWVCLSEQIKENNNTIRNLTGEYKKIEPDCREGVRAQLERMKELCKERNSLYGKQNDLKGQKQQIERALER